MIQTTQHQSNQQVRCNWEFFLSQLLFTGVLISFIFPAYYIYSASTHGRQGSGPMMEQILLFPPCVIGYMIYSQVLISRKKFPNYILLSIFALGINIWYSIWSYQSPRYIFYIFPIGISLMVVGGIVVVCILIRIFSHLLNQCCSQMVIVESNV